MCVYVFLEYSRWYMVPCKLEITPPTMKLGKAEMKARSVEMMYYYLNTPNPVQVIWVEILKRMGT